MNGANSLYPERMRFRWARVNPDLPPGIHRPQHPGEDVGWDLSIMQDIVIPPHGTVDAAINCRLELPVGFWAEMKPRSSIAKRGLQLDAGIIDCGYRGPLYVVCRNSKLPGDEMEGELDKITVKAGERIAQLIFHRLHEVWDEEVDEINIQGSARGEAAFGSSGRT